jgi:hypothetical protein
MVFIWRGFGLAVPIVFFLSCWITSFWIENPKLGNAPFIGWSMLWAGITLAFFALASFGETLDENGEPTGKKAYHDFFWIPIWAWCLGFVAGSIYLINQDPPATFDYNYNETEIEETYTEVEEEVQERRLNLYNCSADSIKINITETYTDGDTYNFYVQNNDYEYVSILPNDYTVMMNDYEDKIHLKESESSDYTGAWLVLCAEVDLVLVDVTEICGIDVTTKEIEEINWKKRVIERFHGDDLIEPNLTSKNGGEVKVVSPNTYIPEELDKNQSVYILIGITRSDEVTQEFLEEKVAKVCVR